MRPAERVTHAFERIEAARRPEAWIQLRSREEALADARRIEGRLAAGAQLPLAGATLAVKDNIDVAGLPTTAGCPSFAYLPDHDAPAVARLRAAGAIVLGKTNMDQFATGLTGTRSPYGAVRDARDTARASGGSSSGSAVAVALGHAELALGTDTAGSGRVPAAFQGIVGLKPTRGLVSTRGVVPACRSFDCVSVFAREVADAELALETIAAPDPDDPLTRRWPLDTSLAAPPRPRIAVAPADQLQLLSPAAIQALGKAIGRLRALGAELVEIDIEPFLQAGELLYGGAFVAERYAAVGEFIAAHPGAVDSTVAAIILGAGSISAHAYVSDLGRLDAHRLAACEAMRGFDALLLPSAPHQPTLAEVAGAPLEVGRRLGTYATFCNLLDMCAIAVPAGDADGGCFGVTFFAPAFHDRGVCELAHRFLAVPDAASAGLPTVNGAGQPPQQTRRVAGLQPPAIELLVVGAHLSGQPLNGELTRRGGRLLGTVRTAPDYRLYRLATMPAKPGLIRVAGSSRGGGPGMSIEGELWALAPAELASLLGELPAPMTLGRVSLEDGSEVLGFLCEPAGLEDAQEITEHGGWRAYLRS